MLKYRYDSKTQPVYLIERYEAQTLYVLHYTVKTLQDK